MLKLAEWPADARRRLRGVFFDIDDTITTEGALTAAAYGGIERLREAGLVTVPVTGRPAGWCDHIARMWPVDGVVGENGAFYFRYEHEQRRMQRRYVFDADARAGQRARLATIGREIVERVPGSAIAADQAYRESDLAIDYCEDVPRLPPAAVEEIVAIMRGHGLTARVSSIHVNGWFGEYDKLGMTQTLMQECHGVDLHAGRDAYTFIGDSPNDAPMFAFFPCSIGVANVRDFGTGIASPPCYVTTARGGAGFREAAEAILAARKEIP